MEISIDRGEGATYCIGDWIEVCTQVSCPTYVEVYRIIRDGEPALMGSGRTQDKDCTWGGYVGEPEGVHKVRAWATGGATDETWFTASSCGDTIVEGDVVECYGAGWPVQLWGPYENILVGQTTTDQGGHFEMRFPAGDPDSPAGPGYWLTVCDGVDSVYCESSEEIRIDPGSTNTFWLLGPCHYP